MNQDQKNRTKGDKFNMYNQDGGKAYTNKTRTEKEPIWYGFTRIDMKS